PFDYRPPSLADPEKERPRPMHAGDAPRDPGQRGIALTPIFEAVVNHVDRVCVPMPFANQLGARLHRDSWSGSRSVPLVSGFGERMQSSLDAEAQAAVSLFLHL